VYYYNLSMALNESYRHVSAMITGDNRVRLEILDSTVDPETGEDLPDVMEANLTKEEATSLMYHLQYLISLLPVVK
jgi:hypothetical protein